VSTLYVIFLLAIFDDSTLLLDCDLQLKNKEEEKVWMDIFHW
jgi:hypothetical protein